MKASKEQLENAVLFFAKRFGQEENYKAIFSSAYCSMPTIVKMIAYDMFLREFNAYHCSDEEYDKYKIIHKYATELKQKGSVVYGEN